MNSNTPVMDPQSTQPAGASRPVLRASVNVDIAGEVIGYAAKDGSAGKFNGGEFHECRG